MKDKPEQNGHPEPAERTESSEITEVNPFNSASEFEQKIMGMPNKAIDLKSMPKPIRWFGYFFIGFVLCGVLTMLILGIFHK